MLAPPAGPRRSEAGRTDVPRDAQKRNDRGTAGRPPAGRTYLARRMPVTRRGTAVPAGWLVVLYPEDQWWAGARQAVYPTLFTGALAALAVMAITTMLARRFVAPIQELGRQAAAIAQGQFQPVAVSRRDDEIRDLALSINRMAETLGQLRAVGAAERAAADARAARRRHGPSTPQLRHRRLDGRRTAPAAVSRRRGPAGAGSGRPPIAADGILLAAVSRLGAALGGAAAARRAGAAGARRVGPGRPGLLRMPRSIWASSPPPNRWPCWATPKPCGRSWST